MAITIVELKNEMIQVQKLCKRGIHDIERVDKKAVQPLLDVKKCLLAFLNENSDNVDALRLMYYTECYLINFKKAKEYLEKICELSDNYKDKTNLIGLNELVSKMKEVVLEPKKLLALKVYLENQLVKQTCDHTLKFTKQWLVDNEDKKAHSKIIRGLQNNGGYCDCEVVMNIMD